MKIEDLKIGQKVSLYGYIEAIDIENMCDIENTTTLKINTLARTISVNPKWEEVTIDLDQPKLEVPQFIADYIESCIKAGSGLIWSIRPDRDANELCRLTYDWLFPNGYKLEDGSFPYPFEPDNLVRPDSNNQLKFARAWLAYPNITVEKEKLYTVEIPNPNTVAITILARSIVGDVVIYNEFDNCWKNNSRYQLTEQEIRKDFDWAFRFAKEVTE